jgi:hypothetical protein
MRKLFFLLLAAVTVVGAQALTVNNTAGQLSRNVTNLQITDLTVTGTMDARDFLFITEQLSELTKIDLSRVSIVPVSGGAVLYGTVTNYPANEVPRTAFFGKKLTTVTLPANVESVGFAAFAGCYQLRSVTFPASLTAIDDYAFAGSALTSVEVPASVKVMGKGVFARCESLTSVTIDAAHIGDFTFLGDKQLSQVTLGPAVGNISRGMFNGCTALTRINIDPACRVSRIDDEAFINSGLQDIDINSLGVGTIGEWALAQTKLTNVKLGDGMTVLGEGALAHNPLLATVTLPGMGHNSPEGPNRAPHRPHTIAAVPDYAFAGNGALNAGNVLREGVNTIGDYAFYNVSADIDTMWLPSSVNHLGSMAMAGMIGMKALKADAADVPTLGENVWAGVDQASVPLITLSESTSMYQAADQWMNFFFQADDDYLLGDVNGDGNVNISDVTTLINYLLSGTGDVNVKAADVNEDGSVNISDVTTLINLLLKGSANMTLKAIRTQSVERFARTSDAFVLPKVNITAGEARTILVELKNTEHNYTALQCGLVLPEGIELKAVNGYDRGAGHDFYNMRSEVESNVYNIIGAAMDMATFAGSEGNVMSLTIQASDDFNAKNAELTLTNVILVTAEEGSFLADDAMTHFNDNSGIEQITADKQVAGVRYINVAGQENDVPFDGVNIVVTTYTDGTSTVAKVIK